MLLRNPGSEFSFAMDPPSKGSNRNLGTYALPPEQLGTPANYGTASRSEADAIDGTSFQVPRRQRASPPLLPRGSENSVMEWGSGRQIVLAPENGAAQSQRRATPTTPAAKPTPPPQPWPIFCYLTIVACAIGLAVSMYETPGVLAPLSGSKQPHVNTPSRNYCCASDAVPPGRIRATSSIHNIPYLSPSFLSRQ